MKKILSLILVVIMCFSMCVPALADDGDTVAKLILDMKEKFNINDDEYVFENYSKNEYNSTVTYNLSWRSKASDEYTYQPYISVRVDESGNVEYYNKSRNYSSDIALAKFTEAEAIAKAEEYISIIAPDRATSLAKGKLAESSQYTITFERTVNNIPVAGDSITVNLHPDDLSLERYSASWIDADFPSPDGVIDYTGAKDAYINGIGYELLYNIKTEKGEIKDIYLSYESKDSSAVIDALTGEAIKYSEIVFANATSGAMGDMATEEVALKSLSPEEQKMVDEINNMITKEEAEKIARNIPEFSIRESAKVNSYSVSKNQYGRYITHIYISENKENDFYGARISIDAETKEIISFSESEKTEDTDKTFDAGQAKKKAEDFLNKYYSDKMAEVKPDFIIGEADNYRFTFDRYVNGIRVKNNGISISVDEHTGEIINFTNTWADTQFPSKDDAISLNAIYKNLLTGDNFRLQYVTTVNCVYSIEKGKEITDIDANLVYATVNSPIYDGWLGYEINFRGEPLAKKYSGYRDISGHYCETAAKELGKIGIYFEDTNLQPDKVITQAEFFRFMCQGIYGYYYSSPDEVYRQLISDGILTEDDITENITRINGIKYFIDALGYKDVAQIKDIYNCPFTDVADSMKGYAAIAGGLGIVNNKVDTLRADSLMTRAECLTMIYNYLKK